MGFCPKRAIIKKITDREDEWIFADPHKDGLEKKLNDLEQMAMQTEDFQTLLTAEDGASTIVKDLEEAGASRIFRSANIFENEVAAITKRVSNLKAMKELMPSQTDEDSD